MITKAWYAIKTDVAANTLLSLCFQMALKQFHENFAGPIKKSPIRQFLKMNYFLYQQETEV